MASQERTLVLGHVGAGAGAEDSNLGLNVLNIIIAGLKINLRNTVSLVHRPLCEWNKGYQKRRYGTGLTCLMATVSPVILSIPL